MREGIVVDGQGNLGILRQRFELESFGRRDHHQLAPIPMEPDGHHARRSVHPDVGQARGNLRMEEFLG